VGYFKKSDFRRVLYKGAQKFEDRENKDEKPIQPHRK